MDGSLAPIDKTLAITPVDIECHPQCTRQPSTGLEQSLDWASYGSLKKGFGVNLSLFSTTTKKIEISAIL